MVTKTRVIPESRRFPHEQLSISDIRGLAQLATEATTGVTRIVEGLHQSVWDTIGFPGGKGPGRTRGITGLVYASIHRITRLVGKGADTVLARLQAQFEVDGAARSETPLREAILAALNGVMGDRLVATNNPFATPMSLRYRGEALDEPVRPPMPEATGKILLLIHGLCMNDLQWQTEREGHIVDHGEALSAALGYTPVYLRYNSGRHISQTGRDLAACLERVVTGWPVPVEDLAVVAHSMGGLVIRSAVHYAQQDALRWVDQLKHIVFLGTPHQGAPLERVGDWVDSVLGSTPYTAPFASLGHLRSAGITDLRYGYILDEDWDAGGLAVPLPGTVACYTVAATTATKRGVWADCLLGDGLVPLNSALGQHEDPQRSLLFSEESQWIAYRMNHMALLSSPEVTRQILHWLTPTQA